MAFSQREKKTNSQTGLVTSAKYGLAWTLNEVITLVRYDYSSTESVNYILSGAVLGAGASMTAFAINAYLCFLVDYLTDWEVPEIYYPISTAMLPVTFGPLAGFVYAMAERYKNSRSDSYDEVYGSLKKNFLHFKKIPSAYWNAPKAFLDYPCTMTGYTLSGSLSGLASGFLPMLMAFLPSLGIDFALHELSGNKTNQIFGSNLSAILLVSMMLACTAGLASGFSMGLKEGVKKAEQHRQKGEPTAYQSTTRLIMEMIPESAQHHANKLLALKEETSHVLPNNKWRLTKNTLYRAYPSTALMIVLLGYYALLAKHPVQEPVTEQLTEYFRKTFMYFGLPTFAISHTVTFFREVKDIIAEEKQDHLPKRHTY